MFTCCKCSKLATLFVLFPALRSVRFLKHLVRALVLVLPPPPPSPPSLYQPLSRLPTLRPVTDQPTIRLTTGRLLTEYIPVRIFVASNACTHQTGRFWILHRRIWTRRRQEQRLLRPAGPGEREGRGGRNWAFVFTALACVLSGLTLLFS